MRGFILLLVASFCLVLAFNSYASDRKNSFATGEAYFDVATGHKYIKNSDSTYAEYSKKGELLRNYVPNNLPLLTTNKYIREITREWYLHYERKNNGSRESLLLTSNQTHPEGWSVKNILIPVK